MPTDAEFLKRLLAAFRVEADEHIQAMSNGLLEIENTTDPAARLPIVETIFREAHSLKGAARAVDLSTIEAICQRLESVFAAWKRGEISPEAEQFDTMHQAVDTLRKILESPDPNAFATEIPAIVGQLETLKEGRAEAPKTATAQEKQPAPAAEKPPPSPGPTPPPAPTAEAPPSQPPPAAQPSPPPQPAPSSQPPPPSQPAPPSQPPPEPQAPPISAAERSVLPETIRVSTTKLDALLLEVEDMVSLKLVAGQRASELNEAYTSLVKWRKAWTKFMAGVTTSAPAGDARSREFLDWSQGSLQVLENRIAALARAAGQHRRTVGATIDSLLENTKKLVMLPFSTLLEAFPKLVRDLARDQGKNVGLELHGGDVEIDKRVLEEMKDPLIHLLRNSVDHGLEKPAERERQGKAERGKIEMTVSQVDGSTVEILVTDDGAGINPESVKRAGIKAGLVSAEDAANLPDAEAVSLIFKSGVSTSPILTEVSGRGLGMAIVREKVEKIGGRISVKTTAGKGTIFRILLPLTLSTFRGLLVQSGAQTFVVPAGNVERVTRIRKEDIHSIENRESITLDQEAVSFVRLGDVLELEPGREDDKGGRWIPVLILIASQQRMAFGVDQVLDEQEILVKPLGKPLLRVPNIAGATVLGSGKAVPILNTQDLVVTASRTTRTPAASSPAAETAGKSVLVVEDSITSRMLLKSILETAGYDVRTAVDGMDAWTTLRTEPFDLVVSDVEMPRMTGFDLTSRIRADKRLADLPVVLVTAREAREDRERGIDVGASAYVVKSSFDQSNLLEVVSRLI